MFEIRFELNGRPIDPRNIGDAIEKAMIDTIKTNITKTVGSIRCSEHGSGAKILAKGSDLSNLTFEVSGCCHKLIDEVKSKL